MRILMLNRKSPIVLFFLFSISIGLAENSVDIENDLPIVMNKLRNKQPVTTISDVQLKAADPHRILSLLKPYDKDSSLQVRKIALRYSVRTAKIHPTIPVKQEVVKRLTTDAIDPNSLLRRYTYKWLLSFEKKDFNNTTKSIIRSALIEALSNITVRICGIANIVEELPRLKELLIDEQAYQSAANITGEKKWYFTTGWNARLARARMGSMEDIEKCIALVESEKDIDTRVIRLLPDIGYIRQPIAIRYLQKYLNSNERLSPVKPKAPGELVANYTMSILAESIHNYPVEKRELRNYTQQEIDTCRQWMAQQINLDIIR